MNTYSYNKCKNNTAHPVIDIVHGVSPLVSRQKLFLSQVVLAHMLCSLLLARRGTHNVLAGLAPSVRMQEASLLHLLV